MESFEHTIQAKIWKHPGHGGWHFVTIPTKQSKLIEEQFGPTRRGWGSIPVRVRVGTSMWSTSIFPDKKTHSYIMGIKAEIRKKEGLSEGGTVVLTLMVRGAQYSSSKE